ncbi:hypothetical protein ACJJTC_006553 [Scirpophaga incertulas]
MILDLPFDDWSYFIYCFINLRDILEALMPIQRPPIVNVIVEKNTESEPDSVKARPVLEHQRSRPSNVEKQVTLEEQMICGALQTLNEEAMEDVLQTEPAPGEPPLQLQLQLQLPLPEHVVCLHDHDHDHDHDHCQH